MVLYFGSQIVTVKMLFVVEKGGIFGFRH